MYVIGYMAWALGVLFLGFMYFKEYPTWRKDGDVTNTLVMMVIVPILILTWPVAVFIMLAVFIYAMYYTSVLDRARGRS